MMGDFMALRYTEERNSNIPKRKKLSPSGQFVLNLDKNNVGTFNRVAEDDEVNEGEVQLIILGVVAAVSHLARRVIILKTAPLKSSRQLSTAFSKLPHQAALF